jgi:hypothetical protein
MRTAFVPERHGFAFSNNWTFDEAERTAVNGVFTAIEPIVIAAIQPFVIGSAATLDVVLAALGLPIPIGATTSVAVGPLIHGLIQGVTRAQDTYGLCGGMVFAALDQFHLGRQLDRVRTTEPTRAAGDGRLRERIWKRLFDSLTGGGVAAKTVEWMALLQFVPDAAGGGSRGLFNRTAAELVKVRALLDRGEPVALGLIGTTLNPLEQHQVLAIGYHDAGGGNVVLYVYDPNHAKCEVRIEVCPARSQLVESHPHPVRGQLHGFFCAGYGRHSEPFSTELVKGSGPATFALIGNTRRQIPSDRTFEAHGFDRSMLRTVADADLARISVGSPIGMIPPDGTFIVATEDRNESYVIEKGRVRITPPPVAGTPVVVMPQAAIAELPSGETSPVFYRRGARSDPNERLTKELRFWRPRTGTWGPAPCATEAQWGAPRDIPVPGDYDGDGKIDVAVWRPHNGTWYVIRSRDGAQMVQQWGEPGDIPVPGDYDGDGKTDFAVWRPGNGTWYVIRSSDGAQMVQQWGQAGDIPVPGDYNRDGKTDFAVWRPSEGNWYVFGGRTQQWGQQGDVPVPGDYDGDGKTDFAVWRPGEGNWYVIHSGNGQQVVQQWGVATDIPLPCDTDGNRRTNFVIWRPQEGRWYVFGREPVCLEDVTVVPTW